MTFAVSPRHTVEKLASGKIEDFADVFEAQVMGWLVEPANHLRYSQHAGYAILSIVLPYFESIAQFIEGKKRGSEKQFIVGLRAVFPEVPEGTPEGIFSELYDQLRCGIFHRGIAKGKVQIFPGGDFPIAIEWDSAGQVTCIKVVPVNLIDPIVDHLRSYVAKLREPNNADLRRNFEVWFRERAS